MSRHTNGSRLSQALKEETATQPDERRSSGGRTPRMGGRTARRRGASAWAAALAALIALVALALPTVSTALPPEGIAGTVSNAEAPGEPIHGAEVCLYKSTSETKVSCATTNVKGEYEIQEPEGSYKVRFVAMGYATQWYSERSTWASADIVEVESGRVKTGIDAGMSEEGDGSIAGRVTSAANGQGAGGVEVCLESESPCVETNANGEYSFSSVPAGSVNIYFNPANGCEEEQGEKIRCEPKSNYLGQSTQVKVRANQTTAVQTALSVGGQISGTVTNASITHPVLAKIEVCAEKVDSKGEPSGGGGCVYTNPSGQYAVGGLESGSYKVDFSGYICTVVKKGSPPECPEVYVAQYYQGQPTFQKAVSVSVTTGANTAGINESLHEAFPVTPASAAAPTLTGTPVVGQQLTCSQGSWAHEPTYLVYQWQRNGTAIAGQSGTTYTLQAADQGHSITCSVLAGNGAGIAGASSNAVVVPVPLALFAGVKVKGSTASVRLRCPGPGACSGVVKILARVVAGHGRHRKTTSLAIGSAHFSIAAGKSATVRVHLTGKGAGLVRKAGRRGLVVRIAGSGVKAHAAKLTAASGKKKKKKH